MAPRLEIVQSRISQTGISRLRALKYGKDLEEQIAPQIAASLKTWLENVAKVAASTWPRRSGDSAKEVATSARVRGFARLDSIYGYFLVSPPVASNEYGTRERRPVTAKMLAIPILDGLYPDGQPKRLGPNSWRYLGTFVYKSRRNGNLYIAYRVQRRLKLLYLLVPRARAIKELRKLRNAWDQNEPALYAAVENAVAAAITDVYIKQFEEALDSIGADLIMKKPPSVIPDATSHAGRLMPKY